MITGESKAPETDRETALGDLAQQLNDTSFFAGNNGNSILQLPDNLNFFSKGDDCGDIDFHPGDQKIDAIDSNGE